MSLTSSPPDSKKKTLQDLLFDTTFSHLFTRCASSDRPFTSSKIKDAVWDCGREKVLGPDRFTFKFIKKYWYFLENDIISYVKHFESSVTEPHLWLTDTPDVGEYTTDSSRVFSVKGMRSHITNSYLTESTDPFRWNKILPLKVNINT
ncbi:hypothetical protein Tco_0299081 [Tanacetum coccineum]